MNARSAKIIISNFLLFLVLLFITTQANAGFSLEAIPRGEASLFFDIYYGSGGNQANQNGTFMDGELVSIADSIDYRILLQEAINSGVWAYRISELAKLDEAYNQVFKSYCIYIENIVNKLLHIAFENETGVIFNSEEMNFIWYHLTNPPFFLDKLYTNSFSLFVYIALQYRYNNIAFSIIQNYSGTLDYNIINNRNSTPLLLIAAEAGNEGIVIALMNNESVDLTVVNELGHDLLYYAAVYGYQGVFMYYVRDSFRFGQLRVYENGNTVLHLLVLNNHIQSLNNLLLSGLYDELLSLDRENIYGHTPLVIAQNNRVDSSCLESLLFFKKSQCPNLIKKQQRIPR